MLKRRQQTLHEPSQCSGRAARAAQQKAPTPGLEPGDPETRSPGPHASTWGQAAAEEAAPTGGRGRPTWRPSWDGGAQRQGEPTAQQVRPLRPAWPHSGLNHDPSRAGHGRHWDPCSPSGACAPPGGAALFPETEPRERDAQPATGGRERARPPSGRAWLGPSTSDKPPPTVTCTSWGRAQALRSPDALTRPRHPPQTPSACAAAPPT